MIFVLTIIFMALIFDFYNGMNDAANSIATIVSTRVLTPLQAVLWAAFFNFIAAFTFGVSVAGTIGKGIIDVSIVDNYVIFSALIGAIFTSAFATHIGYPISISHAIIGGLAGAAFTKVGPAGLNAAGLSKVFLFIFLAPLLGMLIAVILSIITLWIVKNLSPSIVDRYFKKLQLVSAALYSLSHGTNDAQKTMGIITVLLFTNGLLGDQFYVPLWVILSCHFVIALGTLTGGWKVIRTLGMKMTALTPFSGFSAETSAGLTILGASALGIPVSTTHTITGSIAGVGVIKGFRNIKWKIAKNILWAWVLTIPISSFFSFVTYFIIERIFMR